MLDCAHRIDRAFTMLQDQEIHLVQADPMLAGTGAIHGDRAFDHALVDTFGALDIGTVIGIDQHSHVEITVSDMAEALYTGPVAGSPFLAFVVAAAVFTPYLFDTGFTLVRRAWARKNVFSAHREHLYQRISPDPAKHRQVSNVYYALAAVSGLAALLASGGTPARLLVGGLIVASETDRARAPSPIIHSARSIT